MVSVRDILKRKLSKKEMQYLISSYDVIGDIAIIEIKDELLRKEKIIAQSIMEVQKNIKVVCKKVGAHNGKYRRQK